MSPTVGGGGSSEVDLASASLWDGSSEIPLSSTIKMWDGSSEVAVTGFGGGGSGPTFGFVAAVTAAITADNPTLTVPVGVVSGDRMFLLVASANQAETTSVSGGATTIGGTPDDTGTMQALLFTGTGYVAGGTISLTTSAANPSAVAAVWYRGVASYGGIPSAAHKVGTVAALTAPAPTDAANGDKALVLFLEKSGGNSDVSVPAVAGVTNRAWRSWASSATGLPSAWAGDYDVASGTPAAAKTITYPNTSGNGYAVQVRLRAA